MKLPYDDFKKKLKSHFKNIDIMRLNAVHDEYLSNPKMFTAWSEMFDAMDSPELWTAWKRKAFAFYLEWLTDIVEDERQCIAFGIGKTGGGKSTLFQQISVDLHELRHARTEICIDIEKLGESKLEGNERYKAVLRTLITYSYPQALETITGIAQSGESTIMDERQPMWGEGKVKTESRLHTVIESVTRAGKRDFFCCTPEEHEFPDIDAYFDVLGKNRPTRETIAIIRVPAEKTKDKKSPGVAIIVFDIKLSDDEMKWYKERSESAKKRIADAEGSSGSGGIAPKKLDKLANSFLAKLAEIPEG
nr:hypothetical protein [Candidatus Sigynarchaeota archaeon]